jgi:hypothetical protein
MMHRLLPLLLPLLVATPALAQRLTGDRAIDYGGEIIPATQAKSPAGADNVAFRPACRQLTPQVDPVSGQVKWTIQMPDGQVALLYTLENLPEQQAHMELQAAGVCKFGTQADGVVDVPIIYTQDLPVEAIARPSAERTGTVAPTTAVRQPNSLRNLLLMGLVAAGLGGLAYAFMQSQEKGSDAPSKPSGDNDHNDPFGHI